MTDTRDYSRTLRLPATEFPMRALASKPRMDGRLPGLAAREQDLASLSGARKREKAEETYRVLRNCFRWMLGNLSWRNGEGDWEQLPLERYMAMEAGQMYLKVSEALSEGNRERAVELLACFAVEDLLSFYFDVTKDALYCDPSSSRRRLSCLAFMDVLFDGLVRVALPVAPNLAAEAWETRRGTAPMPEGLPEGRAYPDTAFSRGWRDVRAVRKAVGECLEPERLRQAFGSSLELSLRLHVNDPSRAANLTASLWDPATVLCVSRADVISEGMPDGCLRQAGLPWLGVTSRKAEGPRCARSMRHSGDVGSDPMYPDLSERDALALRELALNSMDSGAG